MAVIRATAFGGEVPRAQPRALNAPQAQTYRNLLATSAELRPLADDTEVGSATPGSVTLYRLSREADGSLRADDASGWIAETDDKNYVKGQLNDDATERTVVTWNNGYTAPRVIDAEGENRLLGVPAPLPLTLNHEVVDEFTQEEATKWASDEAMPAVIAAVQASLTESRINAAGTIPTAGPYSNHQLGHSMVDSRDLFMIVTMEGARISGLDSPDLGGVVIDGALFIPVCALPTWGVISDRAGLEAKLRAIQTPKGDQAFPDETITPMVDKLVELFNPAGSSIKATRQSLDEAVRAFRNSGANLPAGGAPGRGPAPVEPTKPTGPEYQAYGGDNEQGYIGYKKNPAWEAYDTQMAEWRRQMAEWNAAGGAAAADDAARGSACAQAQARARTATETIEAEYQRRKTQLTAMVTGAVNDSGALSDIEVEPDRIIDTRFYIATYVTDWGEESMPCRVSEMLEVDQNDSVTVTVRAPPPGRHITHWRLYRSNTGTQGAAFQFVDEMLITTLSYSDSLKGAQLGEVCPSMTWAEPPFRIDLDSPAEIKPPKGSDPYLRGAVAMPNGIVAGYIDNFVAFCHPYHVYAWPVEYQVTTEHPIVGLGVFGQTLFVGTMGNPYLISGTDSASMSAQKMDSEHACVSRRSIVSMGNGVVYASPDGLCMASANGVELITGELFSREDWQALLPNEIIAAAHEGVYYFWTSKGCFAMDFVAKKLGRVDIGATAVYRDVLTDHMFAVVDDKIVKMFSDGRRTATWRSSIVQLPAPEPLSWVQVYGTQDTTAPVTVRWYGDGELRHTAVLSDTKPQRLPAGRYIENEFEIETKARVMLLTVAGSTQELRIA